MTFGWIPIGSPGWRYTDAELVAIRAGLREANQQAREECLRRGIKLHPRIEAARRAHDAIKAEESDR